MIDIASHFFPNKRFAALHFAAHYGIVCEACQRDIRSGLAASINVIKTAKDKSQFFTRGDIAWRLMQIMRKRYELSSFLCVEPSAGTGAISQWLPPDRIAYDIEPQDGRTIVSDFLHNSLPATERIAVIGNPPFGQDMAVKFFNHAATHANVIAFVLPFSFRKLRVQNRLNEDFHLNLEVELPPNSFIFDRKLFNVGAVFQIWERRTDPRALHHVPTKHPDFRFTNNRDADFAVRRNGSTAGQVVAAMNGKSGDYHYIKATGPNVKSIMRAIDYDVPKKLSSTQLSLNKPELAVLYEECKINHRGGSAIIGKPKTLLPAMPEKVKGGFVWDPDQKPFSECFCDTKERSASIRPY